MHPFLPNWLRSTELVVTPELLNVRDAGITALTQRREDPLVLDLVRLAFGRSEDAITHLPAIRQAFKDHDPAFLMRDNWSELQVLAFATVMTVLGKGESNQADLAAMAVECLTFAGTTPTTHTAELVEAARIYLDAEASRVRAIEAIPESSTPDLGKALATLQTQVEQEGFNSTSGEQLVAVLKTIGDALPRVSDLHANQRVLEEEARILWWFVGEHSISRHVAITDLKVGEACTVLSKELADLTQYHPGSPAARDLLARLIQRIRKRSTAKASLRDAVNGVPDDWRRMALKGKDIAPISDLCPGLEALRVSLEHPGAWEQAVQTRCHVDVAQSVEPADLAYHLYVEWTLLKRVADFA